jgi:hypothetical protein
MAPRVELFEFRYHDPRTGKWVRARYVAELHEIAARYAEFEFGGYHEEMAPLVLKQAPAVTLVSENAQHHFVRKPVSHADFGL